MSSGREMGFMDKTFANTNVVVLVLFAICCSGIALIFGIIGLVTCTDAKAKSNAKLTTIIAAIVTVIGIILNVVSVLMSVTMAPGN